VINTIAELAEHLGTESDRVGRRLYKDTSCGIGFHHDASGVTVSGYCEGTDADCPAHHLAWGFSAEQFDAAVEEADQDGCAMWDATHGCEDCGCDGEVNPGCTTCGGDGVVI
jgi:hypothetical protein